MSPSPSVVLLALLSLLSAVPAWSANLSVGVQPMLVDRCSGARFQALADYLNEQMEAKVDVVSIDENRAFRRAVDEGAYDIIVTTKNFLESTGLNESVSVVATSTTPRDYRLVTRAHHDVDLGTGVAGMTIAGESAPSRSSQAFVTLFPNPVRQPGYRPTQSIGEAWRLLSNHSVDAALVPMRGDNCGRSMQVLKDVPVEIEVNVSVAPHLDPGQKVSLLRALSGVAQHVSGLKALDNAALMGFEPVPVQVTQVAHGI